MQLLLYARNGVFLQRSLSPLVAAGSTIGETLMQNRDQRLPAHIAGRISRRLGYTRRLSLDGILRSLIDMLDASLDEQMIKSALENFAQAHGFDRFAYLQAEALDIKTFNSYPEPWQDLYLGSHYSRIDPVVTQAKRRRDIFEWSAEDWSSRGSSSLRRFRDGAMDHGIRSGITIPAEGSFGSTLMLTLASAKKRVDTPRFLDTRTSLQIAIAVHYRLKDLATSMIISPKRMLSPREITCLTWAAKGRSTHETAMLTGINARTVQHHLDSARRKFDAKTLPQLVAMAKDRGLL